MPIFFGTDEDVGELESWKGIRVSSTKAQDAIEYAPLAGKRWRYYAGRNETATSLNDLTDRSKASKAEIGFLLTGRANWEPTPARTLVFAWCRRTYCNHLVLDFLAVHPEALDKAKGYGRLGPAMLLALSFISKKLRAPVLWGEATNESAGFYEGVIRRYGGRNKVKDHFFFRNKILEGLRFESERYQVPSRP